MKVVPLSSDHNIQIGSFSVILMSKVEVRDVGGEDLLQEMAARFAVLVIVMVAMWMATVDIVLLHCCVVTEDSGLTTYTSLAACTQTKVGFFLQLLNNCWTNS